MSGSKRNNKLISNEDQKRLDITINTSHNKVLSDNSVIQLVKLLARQAAEEDYMRSITHNDQGGEPYEKAR